MSCQDLTEIIEITLSSDYKLLDYSLRKLSCDKEIGENSLLLKRFKGKEIYEILESSEVDLLKDLSDETEKYLNLKHFQVLCKTLNVLIGNEEQGSCQIESVDANEDTIKVIAQFSSKNNPAKSSSCAGCQGCSKKRLTSYPFSL
ncbi:MAG: hypothetical protein PHU71_01000 [Candidatus Gracilibacteria bacterium]|nr:hypothetical protein [Candidatus Gracilibacteria bacterium]